MSLWPCGLHWKRLYFSSPIILGLAQSNDNLKRKFLVSCFLCDWPLRVLTLVFNANQFSTEWVPVLRNNKKRPKKKKNCYFKAKSFNLSLVFATLLWTKLPSIPVTIQTTKKPVGLVSSTVKKEKHLYLSKAKEYRLEKSQKLWWKACTLANFLKRFRKRTQDQVEQLIKQIAGFVCGLSNIVWHKK